MIDLQTVEGGVLLPVQAQPKASRNGVTGVHGGRLKVSVTQAPEKGKANTAVVQVLAKSLGLRKSQLTLVSGETSPKKTFRVDDTTVAELQTAIAAVLGSGERPSAG
jgi:uncharacterized protein (TIGR00251 family)